MGVRRRRAPSPGARAQQRVTHLQARSPLALATVQSRPVALRPILPTTVSRTYCLCRGRKGDPQGSGQPTTCSRGTRSGVPVAGLLFLWGELLSQGSGGAARQTLSAGRHPTNPEQGTGAFPKTAGRAAPQSQQRGSRRGRERSRQRSLKRRDDDMQSVTLGGIPDEETKKPEATGNTGQALSDRTTLTSFTAHCGRANGRAQLLGGRWSLGGLGSWARRSATYPSTAQQVTNKVWQNVNSCRI